MVLVQIPDHRVNGACQDELLQFLQVQEVDRSARHPEATDEERVAALDQTGGLLQGDHGSSLHVWAPSIRSMTAASPCPTPTHRVTRP